MSGWCAQEKVPKDRNPGEPQVWPGPFMSQQQHLTPTLSDAAPAQKGTAVGQDHQSLADCQEMLLLRCEGPGPTPEAHLGSDPGYLFMSV